MQRYSHQFFSHLHLFLFIANKPFLKSFPLLIFSSILVHELHKTQCLNIQNKHPNNEHCKWLGLRVQDGAVFLI